MSRSDAALERRRCKKKIPYADRATAQANASGRQPYQCGHCGLFHLKRTRECPKRELAAIVQECSAPDWDGYGAMPIDRKSVQYVCQFLEKLPSEISQPELSADPNGDLTMVWLKHGYHLIIGIDSGGQIAWGGTSPRGCVYGDMQFNSAIPEELVNILRSIEG